MSLMSSPKLTSTNSVSPSPVPPVQGHRHGHGEGETELVEVNFGDDVNDIRGSVLVVPEPNTSAMVLAGLGVLGFARRRRDRKAA